MWYEVHVHFYGRPLCRKDGPCQGLLDWPRHKWVHIATVNGRAKAIDLADTQAHHAVVTPAHDSQKVYDNGLAPALPDGWWPPDATTCLDSRPVGVPIPEGGV